MEPSEYSSTPFNAARFRLFLVGSLALSNLTISAGGKVLLESFDLTIRSGELVGVTGPSGCGKTTLLRAVAGLCDASSGEVRLDGRSPGDTGWPGFRSRVVLVQQEPKLFEGTVEENLRRPFGYRNVEREYSRPDARDRLKEFALDSVSLDSDAGSLSVGERQRVCLIRALSLKPDFLLLDEPTSALDEDNVVVVEEILRRSVSRQETGIFLATHDRLQVERLGARPVDLSAFLPEGCGVESYE